MSKKLTMTMMRLQGDLTEYRGKTPETIARRLYGKAARIVRSADPNSPVWGQIVRESRYGGYEVLAVIVTCDIKTGEHDEKEEE